jgi:uncharacterized membrane protein YbhN (UPF0104 family)
MLAAGSAVAQGACVLVIAVAQLPGTSPLGLLTVISTFMVSHVAGVLVFISPAGIGIREGVQAVMLSGNFTPALLAAFLVSSRAIDIMADALFALCGGIMLLATSRTPLRGRLKREHD